MFERHIEENPYVYMLVKSLNTRCRQLPLLYLLEEQDNPFSNLITKYNHFILEVRSKFNFDKSTTPFIESDFFELFYPLRAVLYCLNRYNQAMSIYQTISTTDFNNYSLLSHQLKNNEFSMLDVDKLETIQRNNTCLFGNSYYELYQVNISLKSFVNYIKTDFRSKIEHKCSLTQVLLVIMTNPFSLWSAKGWYLLSQRALIQQKLLQELKSVDSLCKKALRLNAFQIQYRYQFSLRSTRLSLREKDSLTKLVNDPFIEKHLKSVGVCDHKNIFNDLMNKKETYYQDSALASSSTIDFSSDLFSQNKNTQIAEEYFDLNILRSLYDTNFSSLYFGLKYSIIEGFLYYSNSGLFDNSLEKNRNLEIYKNRLFDLFCETKGMLDNKRNVFEQKRIFQLYEEIVRLIQKSEKKLKRTQEGSKILDILKYFKQSLFSLQFSSVENSQMNLSYSRGCQQ